jgi:hypothetical protein
MLGKSYFSAELCRIPLNYSSHHKKMKILKYQSFKNKKLELKPEILNIP